MSNSTFKLVTIICEPVLSTVLLAKIRSLGASGFTITDVRGEGSGEKRSGEIPDVKIKLEIIADAELSKKIMSEVAQHYFDNSSLVMYSADIQVIRQEKF